MLRYLSRMTEGLMLYTAAEVAEILRLHVQVVQRKLQAGEIPAYRIGKEWRVAHHHLIEWLERYSNQRTRPLTDRWFDASGRLKAMPAQRAKRRAVIDRIADRFESGRSYKESEVNELLRQVFDDVAYLRRELVAEKILRRSRGIYELDPGLAGQRG